MRSMDYLVSLYPDKKGSELIEIQNQDKLDDQRGFEQLNHLKLEIIKDINENGGYFYGRFGCDQRYYYRFYDLRLEGSKIYMAVDSLVFFYNNPEENHRPNSSVKRDGEMSFEFRTREFEDFDKFGIDMKKDRVTVKEWDEVLNYVKELSKFWEKIKPF
jgi:hypothetical protein